MQKAEGDMPKNTKQHAVSSSSHQPTNAGDFCGNLEITQESVAGGLPSMNEFERKNISDNRNDNSDGVDSTKLLKCVLKSKRPIRSKSTNSLNVNKFHIETTKILAVERKSNKLKASKCEFCLDASYTSTSNQQSPRTSYEEAPCEEVQKTTESGQLGQFVKNMASFQLRKCKSVPTTKITKSAEHPKPILKKQESKPKSQNRRSTDESPRTSEISQCSSSEKSPTPGTSTTNDDYYDDYQEPSTESEKTEQDENENSIKTQPYRQMSPIPGPSSRSDDYYDNFKCNSESTLKPRDGGQLTSIYKSSSNTDDGYICPCGCGANLQQETEYEPGQENTEEHVSIKIPFNFLNQYLHVFDHKLERAAVHVKYGQVVECTCEQNDIGDPCLKHIDVGKLQFYPDAVNAMEIYWNSNVDEETFSESEKIIKELCPVFYESFLKEPHDLSDDEFIEKNTKSQYNVVCLVRALIQEEDNLAEFLEIDEEIGEKRCLNIEGTLDEFNLAMEFLMEEYPALFVQITLQYEFTELAKIKGIVAENKTVLIEMSKMTREELLEFDDELQEE